MLTGVSQIFCPRDRIWNRRITGSHLMCPPISARKKVASFYSEVSILFAVRDAAQHYHIPLLLSPYGYTTYRGR